MNKKLKQIAASLLSVLMIVCFMPSMAFAADGDVSSTTYDVVTDIPDQAWTGDVPDLMNLDALAKIKVKPVGGDASQVLELTRGTHFTVEAKEAGPGEVDAYFTMIKDDSNPYANDVINSKKFNVTKETATDSYTVTVDKTKIAYTGKTLTGAEVAAAATVKNGTETLYYPEDYSVVLDKETAKDAGDVAKATFKVGTKTIAEESVTIAKRDLATLILSGTQASALEYSGKAQEVAISDVQGKVSKDATDTIAVAAADYTVSGYENNINAGNEAKVVIAAKSTSKNFTGTGKVNFTIGQYDLSKAYVAPLEAKKVTFNGKVQTPEVAPTVAFTNAFGSDTIAADNYKVAYVNDKSKDAGTYKIKVVPKDNKGNLKEKTSAVDAYIIEALSIKSATKEQKQDVEAGTDLTANNVFDFFTVKAGEYELVKGDVKVEVSGKTGEAGETCTVKLSAAEGNNNLKDSYSFTYVVAPKTISGVYESKTPFTYSGKEQVPTATQLGSLYVDNKVELTASDYQVTGSWANNKNVGTATAAIKGTGKFRGTATVEYKISPLVLSGYTATVTEIKDHGVYYKGAEIAEAKVTLKKGNETLNLTADDCTVVCDTFDTTGQSKLTGVLVKLKGNYAGDDIPATVDVISNTADLDNAQVTGDIPAGLKAYDADAVKKYITVKANDVEVTPDAYNVEITNATATNYGTLGTEVKFILTPAVAQLTGRKTDASAKIVARDIKDLEEGISVANAVYTGEEQKPIPTVSVEGTDAKEVDVDKDYTISYKDNLDAGTATVTLTGKGNYTGTVSKTFEIAKANINWSNVELTGIDSQEYKAAAPADLSAELKLVVKKNAASTYKVKFDASDYAIKLDTKYADEAKAGRYPAVGSRIDYVVTISKDSKNFNESESTLASYTIITKTATDAEVTVENTLFEVGKTVNTAALGKVTVKLDGTELVEGTDYTVAVEGTTSKVTSQLTADEAKPFVVVTFRGNYVGKVKKAISIVSKVIDINDVVLEAPSAADCVYTGRPIVPAEKDTGSDRLVKNKAEYYTVKYVDAEGNVLTEKDPKDGTVIYKQPTDVGTYTATVISKPNYGSVEGNSVTYTITARKISKGEFERNIKADNVALENVQYFGEFTDEPEFAVNPQGQYIVEDYDTTWDGNPETKGTAKIGYAEDANYTCDSTVDVQFTWIPGDISEIEDVNDYFMIPDQKYTGRALTPDVVAVEGCDMDPAWVTIGRYDNNIEASNKTAVAYVSKIEVPKGEKKYTGTYKPSYDDVAGSKIVFNILPADGLTVTVEDASYTGSPVTPAVTVKNADGAVLKEGTDYSVAFENNTYVGEGTVTVTGKGNYGGTATATFKIKEDAAKVEDANKAATEAAKAASAVTEANGYSKEDAAAVKAAADALAAVQAKDNATVKELSDATKALTDAIAKADANKAADKASEAAAGVTAAAGYEAADVTAVKKAANALAAAKAKSGATAAEIQAATKALNAAVATANKNAKKAPAKVKLNKKKTKSAKKGKVTVVWKKVKGAKGYQVKVGKKTYNVKGAKKVKKIFKAKKGKRIAVKVRAYKVFKGKKIYGKWSAAKKVKIKK